MADDGLVGDLVRPTIFQVACVVWLIQKQRAGPTMTLGNMRDLGVKRLIASCLNDACRHTALIEVWSYHR